MRSSFDLHALIIGDAAPTRALRQTIATIAESDLNVLVVGPTGAGKELVAEGLHALSGRSGDFVAVNVGGVPDAMFEDEFFGHARGAFTGAVGARAGLLLAAHRGTLLLDEVTSLSSLAQPKLLRALETRRFRPVGARHEDMSDFRLVSATNADVDALVATGGFRRDLRRRLEAFTIRVPSLTERRSDVPLLARHFLDRSAQARGTKVEIDDRAMRALTDYDWPDNIRELRQVIECALVFHVGSHVSHADVLAALGDRAARRPGLVAAPDDDFSRRRLLQLLDAHDWNARLVAKALGIHRATVHRHIERFALRREADDVTARAAVRGVATQSQSQSIGATATGDGATATGDQTATLA